MTESIITTSSAGSPDPSGRRATAISIIVPVLNEAELIRSCLTNLRRCAPKAEIIVVDGGSSDGTYELAVELSDQCVVSARCGRAAQMNEGARIARGEIFWFLHVDAEVPPFCLDEIRSALRRPEFVGGFFRVRIPKSSFVYRLTDGFAHYAGIVLRMRCGDHGMFCRRDVFVRIGGFPDVPVMEDVEFFRRLHRIGKIGRIKKHLIVSARRYELVGPVRLTLAYGFIAILYAVGMPWPILASLYSRFCQFRE
ncbi:MAG: hypothetical protein JWO45_1895 [Spartobacteria bacterium]|nr:hypothetical protein [Spartobacteria bacterium]